MNAKTALVLAGFGAVLAYLVYRSARDGIAAAATAVNPLSDKNAAYSGVNAVGSAVSGSKDWSLGVAIYDWFHPEYDPNAAPLLQTRKQAIGDQFYDSGWFSLKGTIQ